VSGEPRPAPVAPEVRAELPDLRLWTQEVAPPPGWSPSTPELRERLRALSDRVTGSRAIALRRDPVPHAYRVCFRQLGLDPDTELTPVEAAMKARMEAGRFVSRNRLDDALVIAVVETGVPVWALDRDQVEPFADHALELRAEGGALVVADALGPVAELFRPVRPGRGVTPETRAVLLFTVGVRGVPAVHVEEALWLVAEALDPAA
jgi:DNA/RNA-binding domain of Phe-tRNA-synthetase-like protein